MPKRKACVISKDNGVGLTRDSEIVSGLLEDFGYSVHQFSPEVGPNTPSDFNFDVAIHLEIVSGFFWKVAEKHILIPNQEWFIWWNSLPRFDRVFCKTHHAKSLFSSHAPTYYTSFTSQDRFLPDVKKEMSFIHTAGKSRLKNTRAVIDAWNEHPEWPNLHLYNAFGDLSALITGSNIFYVGEYVTDSYLRAAQNRSLFHIMPSAAEGFGHVLWEALSTGAILITTDAPPMREIPTPFLCSADRGKRHGWDYLHTVSAQAVTDQVERVLSLTDEERRAYSFKSREAFVLNHRLFELKFKTALQEVVR